MTVRSAMRGATALAFLLLWAAPAQATDGHFLHGVGAVNSAMGGAGVAAPGDLLGSFYLNPAGLICEHGSRIALGFELFKPNRAVASEAGPYAGRTVSKSAFTPIPSFGWATKVNDDLSVGVGALGIGGFGVDYPADVTNPILGPRPQGFGQVDSNFQLMKISPALALRVNDRVTLGAALNVDWASLAVDPMPAGSPAIDAGEDGVPGTADDRAFFSRATASDGAFGFGFQAGLIVRATDALRLGLSYTSPQWFQDFEFNSVYENPNLPNFGQPRTIGFAMDVPAVYAGGLALSSGRLLWTGDVRFITYSRTAGFDKSGYDQTMAVTGFGWDDILVLATGLQVRPREGLALRAGYNYAQNPVPDELSVFNVPAPAIVQHHLSAGIGFSITDAFQIDAGYYHAFRNEISGPMQTPMGPMPGTSVTSSMDENSFLIQFSFMPSAN